jgi:hypothetical protein
MLARGRPIPFGPLSYLTAVDTTSGTAVAVDHTNNWWR